MEYIYTAFFSTKANACVHFFLPFFLLRLKTKEKIECASYELRECVEAVGRLGNGRQSLMERGHVAELSYPVQL